MTLAVTVAAKQTFRMDKRERRAVKFRQGRSVPHPSASLICEVFEGQLDPSSWGC